MAHARRPRIDGRSGVSYGPAVTSSHLARIAAQGTARRRRSDTVELRIAVATAAVLAAVTTAFAVSNPLRFAIRSPDLDLATHVVGALVCAAVAALCHARSRTEGSTGGLLLAAAFVVLATANALNATVVILGLDPMVGLSLDAPGQVPLYAWAASRLLSASLLAAGALISAERSARIARLGMRILWLPAALFVVTCVGLWLAADRLPALLHPATLRLLADEATATSPLPGLSVGILLFDGAAAALLLVGAFGYARRTDTTIGIPRRFLVVGLVLAAFAQVHFTLYPAVYAGLVSTGDALRIAFYLVLIAGIYAATTADVRALRAANTRLRLLAAAEADRTAIAERARLARELHDGLAQDLWTAKLEFDRLTKDLDTTDPGLDRQVRRVGDALDSSLHEARDAVHTLRSGFDAGLSFADELPRRLDAFIERTDYVVDLDLDPHATAALPGVAAADLLRIVDEALHNAQKHADATRIRVRVAAEPGGLVVSVTDNGQGFDVAEITSGHGIDGMRERASLLGGTLEIDSAEGDGTTVAVHVPTEPVGGP
jgi:signal transduction histidine kinase